MISIRNIGVIGRTYRHLNRYRQILAILIRYGFGDLIERLKIDEYIEVGLRMISREESPSQPVERLTSAERIRMAIEELGPTYIKFGQALSTRSDLVPEVFMQELYQLQDQVSFCPFSEVKRTIEAEFERDIKALFDTFEETPLASASIGQVHKAALKNGYTVAVKIQRPGIRKIIEVDLEILLHLATLAERHIEEMAFHSPVKIVEEFARTLEKEIDYTIEAANMERFGRQFQNDPEVYVPKVFRHITTERVLTMEFIRGIKISEIEQLETAGLDRRLINARGARFILRQVFEHGFFHADPHPGNICVLRDNVICLFDFGMVGSIDRHTREDFVDLLESVVLRNEIRTARAVLKLTTYDDEPDIRSLERDLADFMGVHLYKPLKDIKIGRLLADLLNLLSRRGLRIRPDIFSMMKAFSQVEGIGLLLDPKFDMITEAVPFIESVKLSRFSQERITDGMFRIFLEMTQFIRQFPKDTLEITRQVRQRKLTLRLDHQGLETILATHDEISNKISFSIIIAALIIGSALIVVARIPPLIYGISLVGILLFSGAAILGIWLLVVIIKRGRVK